MEKIREGEFRSYDVSVPEMIEWTKKFLPYVGYELLPEDYIGFVRPDFRARRRAGDKTFEVIGVVRGGIDEAVEGYARLLAMKATLGDEPDYVLVLPPVNEYLLIEFLMEDKGKWFYEIKKHQFMMWLGNPTQETMWCILGSPRDTRFNDFFVLTKMNIDFYIGMKLAQEEWAEEEAEYER